MPRLPTMSESAPLNIVLCVCTYRRPDGLKKLLDSLPSLELDHPLQVVVADNDDARQGIDVCQNIGPDYPFTIHTLSATEPGISAARNAATLEALRLQPDLIAFLDDDEWPEPQWLAELVRVQQQCDVAAVGGPTRPVFPDDAPEDIRTNPYYGADMGLPDESICQLQAGGNFLIKADVMRGYAPDFFHPDFAHSGGEDLAFFMQLSHHGHRMAWAAQAIVHEPVPPSRLQPDWMRRRVVNIHNSRVRVMQLLQPGAKAGITRGLKTVALGIVALSLSAVAWLSPALADQARQLRWKFAGKFSAHLGRATVRSETY